MTLRTRTETFRLLLSARSGSALRLPDEGEL